MGEFKVFESECQIEYFIQPVLWKALSERTRGFFRAAYLPEEIPVVVPFILQMRYLIFAALTDWPSS